MGDEEGVVISSCDKVVIGNMLLREHFRNLTIALMRPFDSYFKTNSNNSNRGVGSCDPLAILERFSSNTGNSMFCGSEDRHIDSLAYVIEAIEVFGRSEHNDVQLPRCLRSSQWRVLMELFAHSDHFTCWSDWKRDVMAHS